MPSFSRVAAIALVCTVLGPAASLAQVGGNEASITGVVKDPSGAVLPGVTVEVASSVLIERARVAVTDGSGQYRVTALPPGTYTVTFTLTGFSTIRREGVVLEGSLTATVSESLRVGTVTETVTVTGETPIVDVQSSKVRQVITSDTIAEIPTARVYHSIANLVASVTSSNQSDVGGINGPATVTFTAHGGRSNEGRLQVDGQSVGASLNGSGVSYYVADIGNAAEVTFSVSGGMGEAEVGGPVMSVVPRTGGNAFHGTLFANGASEWMGSQNINPELLRDASVSGSVGVTQGNTLLKIWDLNDTVGGPILKDRLWFYGGFRYQGNRKLVAPGQMFYNANYADNSKFLYVADKSQPAKDDGTWTSSNVRLTWQQSARSKMNFFVDSQTVCSTGCIYGGSATVAPEARTRSDSKPYVNTQVTWTSPMTNKILFEAGFSALHGVWGGKESDPNPTHDLIRMTENCSTSAGCPLNGNIAGLAYRSQNWAHNIADTPRWQASMAYVTGAHSLKFGYQGQWIQATAQSFTNTQALSYTVQNGVPISFTMNGNAGNISTSRSKSASVYAQDQSTFGRLTVQGAIRYDRAWSDFPEQTTGGTKFLPQVFHWDATYGVKGYNDITPRMGAVYDLFGNGKTSLKVSLGRYLEAATNGVSYTTRQPSTSISGSATRNWTDGNRNYAIDCDLFSTVAQDNRASGGDFCAALPTTFGTNTVTTVQDPRIFNGGWGIRPGDWNFTGSWQQEILPRASVEVSFTHRWFQGFGVTDNRALNVNSYDPYYVIAPLDSRLPGGGGYRIDGLLNVKPEFATVTAQNFATLVQFLEDDLGKDLNRYQYYNGVDVTFNMRMQNGIRFQGGTSTGHSVNDTCGVRAVLPETGPTSYDCHTAGALLTRATGLASYTIPKVDVLVSGTFQSNPPDTLSATYAFTTAQVTPWLGRALSNNSATVNIDLLTSSEMYAPNRTNEVDFRVAKILKFGRTRTNVGVDLYNVFNRNTPQGYNTTFSPVGAWPRVTSVFPARFAKVSAQIDF